MSRQYIVKFESLGLGEHHLEFDIDKSLFEENDEVLDARFSVDLDLYKTGNMMDMKFRYSGTFSLPCDRCNEALDVFIADHSNLAVKFGQNHHEDLDELIILEDHEHELDLEQYFYENLSLLIPQRNVHDEDKCDPDILSKLSGSSDQNEDDDTDPRWEKLKEI